MLQIDYNINVGSVSFKPASNSRLVELRSSSSMNAPVHYCRMVFTLPSDLSMAVGDEVKVDLGYEGDTTTVFTGVVIGVEWQVTTVTIEAESQTRQLTALHVNAYFENSFAADIVNDLLGETDMSAGQVQQGLRFSFYAIGSNRSAWDQLNALSKQCGFDMYADADDKLVFATALPGVPKMFQFAVNVLKLKIEQRQEAVSGVEVFGESPSSFGGGPDSVTWFGKKDVTGSAGSDPKRRAYVPAARTQELAAQIANNLWNGISPKKIGKLTTLGDSTLALGGTIQISDMPVDDQNGSFRIIEVGHSVHSSKGFVTTVSIEEQ
jgi:hypothetical protein